MPGTDLLWPAAGGPDDLPAIEQIPLDQRGLPASTYELVVRGAELWPEKPAVSVLADAEHWETPVTRTFAQLASDVHRAANVLADLGVERGDAVAVMSVNCDELLSAFLAAEAVGIYAPINPGLSVEHATHLVRLSGARLIVAAGPELDEQIWALAREIAAQTGARALLALRPTGASGPPPALEPLGSVDVDYLQERMTATADALLRGPAPAATDVASYLHTGGTTGTPKLAVRTHANEVTNAWSEAMTMTGGSTTPSGRYSHAAQLVPSESNERSSRV